MIKGEKRRWECFKGRPRKLHLHLVHYPGHTNEDCILCCICDTPIPLVADKMYSERFIFLETFSIDQKEKLLRFHTTSQREICFAEYVGIPLGGLGKFTQQGSTNRRAPGCMNAAGKLRQKW